MTNIGCLGRINSDSLWWFSSIFEVKWIWNLLSYIRDFVSFYITWCSNTESIYGKSVCAELTWKICFLIYHAMIEHRAWTREDIRCWHGWLFWSENNYLWPSFYCMINDFPFGDHSWSSGHFSHLFYLIIRRRNCKRVTWREPSAFILFWVYLLVDVYTLVSSVHTVFYKPCWWEYMFQWTFITENWWAITWGVWFVDEWISSRV